ncbi:staygreen family protein [Tepidibacter hydrothermalis]|uniref:Staygreen family protein n=1 Tax=Tepidibacter hydrothermalis TaxID=3036126 RepID=A0ABY8EFE1_9FIRM|nr:staygreen family protein [Tepidibacter hydrothermalis]WFD11658.1 staygreen family protein [Tepidibacter hydrothermalis]
MSNFDKSKLHVTFMDGVNKVSPIIPRKYTLTHSDETGELFLDIGKDYNYKAITSFRDEVLGKWINFNNMYYLQLYAYISGGEFDFKRSAIRYNIFQKELPLALTAIINGDKTFYKAHPYLYNSPIFIKFNSIYPAFNKVEYFGRVKDYFI